MVLLPVDGLGHRYLRDSDKLGLKIHNIRRMMREGTWAKSVVGEVPTITWPADTTILTGVPPSIHGIQANQRFASRGRSGPDRPRRVLPAAIAPQSERSALWPFPGT